MKNNFKTMMSAALAIGLLAAGCAKDGGEVPNPDPKSGEKGYAQLTISTVSAPGTRAGATGDQNGQAATAEEMAVNTAIPVRVFLFDAADGKFAESYNVNIDATKTEGTTYTTSSFEVPSGSYYFVVYVNDATGKIGAPVSGVTIDQFMAQPFEVAYTTSGSGEDAVANGALDIATPISGTDGGFLMGTLWKEGTFDASNGTVDNPTAIALDIARLSSKVMVTQAQNVATNMKGKFAPLSYRLSALAGRMSKMGVTDKWTAASWTQSNDTYWLPYGGSDGNKGVRVTSAVDGLAANDPVFVDATGYKMIDGTNFFYATENTTAKTGSPAYQYVGNTTHIWVRSKYTPVNSEVYTVDGNAVGAVVADNDNDYTGGPTFYTAIVNGERLIFATDPDGIEGLTENSIVTYTDGINYHKFPVYDPDETAGQEYRNRVLRNHYYEYQITEIRDLGSYEDTINENEPIDEPSTIVLKVKVRNWEKVSTSTVL